MEIARDGLPTLACDSSSPHLKGLPTTEAVEELESLDFGVEGLFLSPLHDLQEVLRFPSHVLTEALPTDCVVLEVKLSFMRPDGLKVDQFQLVDVLLTASHQIQELLNFIDSLEDEVDVFI